MGVPLIFIIIILSGIGFTLYLMSSKEKPHNLGKYILISLLAIPLIFIFLRMPFSRQILMPGIKLHQFFLAKRLLLIFAGLGVLVFLIFKTGNKGKYILASVAAVAILLVTVYMFMGHQVEYEKTSVINNIVVKQNNETYHESLPSIWMPGIEDQFTADVYPSKAAAIRSLGRRIGEPLKKLLKEMPCELYILVQDNNEGLINELEQAISKKYSTKCHFKKNKIQLDNDITGVKLKFDEVQIQPVPLYESARDNTDSELAIQWDSPALTSGKIKLVVFNNKGDSTIEAKFNEKPWIDNYSDFLNKKPSHQFIIARSQDSCLTPDIAHQQALNDAVNKINMLISQIPAGPKELIAKSNLNITKQDLLDNKIIVDKFSQAFEGVSSMICRQGLLLDVSQKKLNELIKKKTEIFRHNAQTWGEILLSIAGFAALISLVYIFLNAATKGYYTWSLRIAAILLIVVVIVLVLTLA